MMTLAAKYNPLVNGWHLFDQNKHFLLTRSPLRCGAVASESQQPDTVIVLWAYFKWTAEQGERNREGRTRRRLNGMHLSFPSRYPLHLQ